MQFKIEPLGVEGVDAVLYVLWRAFEPPEADMILPMIYLGGLQPDAIESLRGDVLAQHDVGGSSYGFCAREDRKPAYSTTINNMQATKWPEIWELYKGFQAKGPNSAVLIERYNLTKSASAPAGSAAMDERRRKEAFAQAIVIPWYTDASLDAEALSFGEKVRALWSYTPDPKNNPA